jgi:hypothetical protein
MRTTIRSLVCVAILLSCQAIFTSNSLSQAPTVTTQIAPVTELSLSDIDFRNATTPKWLFTVTIQTTGTDTFTMKFVANVSLASGENYSPALTFETEPFVVNGIRAISNLDLDRSVRIKHGTYEFNRPARTRLEAISLSSGQLPAGSYNFSVDVTPAHGSTISVSFPPIIVTNPSALELLSPMDGDANAPQFPIFQWLNDGPSSRLSIFEKLPGQSTLEEAASGVPQFTTVTTTTSLQYPSSGARVLEAGKTYVWYVEGLSSVTGGGTSGRRSSLRSFVVSSNGTQSFNSLLDDLARALPQYQTTFEDLKAQGFSASGTIRLNGSSVSVADLQRLLNRLRQNPDAVSSVDIEQ